MENHEIVFNSSPSHTIGVELEIQILDADTLAFRDIAPIILDNRGAAFKERIKEELITSMVELNTRCCNTMDEVDKDLRESLAHLDKLLAEHNAVPYLSSLHPTEKGTGKNISRNPRYGRIMDDLQIIGRRFITQGMHVHVGIGSAEQAITVNNNFRRYLPLLLALSTSSPYYRGEDTGLFSYRTKLFEALPLAGLPEHLESWEKYQELATLLIKSEVISSVRDLWWDVRPHPDFGTVEIRICDLPCRYSHITALVALIHCLAITLCNKPILSESKVQMELLRANKWQAVRYGIGGIFFDPVTAEHIPIRQAIDELMLFIRPVAQDLDILSYLEPIEDILNNGTGAHRQIQHMITNNSDFNLMIHSMQKEFY